jgi:hypothetical protein
VAGIVAVAGCTETATSGSEENTTTSQTEGSDENTTTSQTEESDETETTPESETTEQLINRPLEDLVLSLDDLPGDGWEVESSDIDSNADKSFEREDSEGNTEEILTQVSTFETVSEAQDTFEAIGYSDFVVGEPTESQNLEVGDESTWLAGDQVDQGSDEQLYIDFTEVRDRNAVGFIIWLERETESVGRDEITGLTQTMVNRWS